MHQTLYKLFMKKIIGLFLFSIPLIVFGQSISAFSFGSIGNIGDVNPKFSGAVNIQGVACFELSNGVKTLQEKNTGEYLNHCEAAIAMNDLLTLTASPNPFQTSTNIKLSQPIYLVNDERVLLQLFNRMGDLVHEYPILLSQLINGSSFQLNVFLKNDLYFLKASSPNRLFKPLSLLKQN